jgi:hypothetical protein
MTQLRQDSGKGEILFEVEPPNLFRDSLVDLELALQAAISSGLPLASIVAGLRSQKAAAQQCLDALHQESSPIDAKYDLERRMRQRLDLWNRVLS